MKAWVWIFTASRSQSKSNERSSKGQSDSEDEGSPLEVITETDLQAFTLTFTPVLDCDWTNSVCAEKLVENW